MTANCPNRPTNSRIGWRAALREPRVEPRTRAHHRLHRFRLPPGTAARHGPRLSPSAGDRPELQHRPYAPQCWSHLWATRCRRHPCVARPSASTPTSGPQHASDAKPRQTRPRVVLASGTRHGNRLNIRERPQRKSPDFQGFPKTGATGLEPATSGVTGRRSNQLSYAPAWARSQGLAHARLQSMPSPLPSTAADPSAEDSRRGARRPGPRRRSARATARRRHRTAEPDGRTPGPVAFGRVRSAQTALATTPTWPASQWEV
jgi:hypothetical protein